MPSHYWYTCDQCKNRWYRYCNVRRCGCGGNLVRNGYTNLVIFHHAGIMLQMLPPEEISEPVLGILSQLDKEHISHVAALISAWIVTGYNADEFRELMRRVEIVKRESKP